MTSAELAARNNSISRYVAAHIATARGSDCPQTVLHEAKRSLLNHIAAGLAGARDAEVEALLAGLLPAVGRGDVGLIGRKEHLAPLDAAFMNAIIANVLDYDDTHLRTVIHPAAPIASALFALAHVRTLSGPELLHAFAIAADIACRLGNAVSPWHYARGWHITATCGVVGAAAGCARLLGLDEGRTLAALGGATAQACGLVETLGTGAKSLGVGTAARAGLLAALAAERGLSGPTSPLEGARGFLAVMGENASADELTDGLGLRWESALNTYKPYPCGIVLHPVIDACLALRDERGFASDAIQRITIRGHPLLRQRTDRGDVSTGREAQVAIRHTVGVSLTRGRAGLAEYTDSAVCDPAVRAVGARVTIEDDAAMGPDAATVTLHLADGRTLAHHVTHARGSLGRPLADAEIEAKAQDAAQASGLAINVAELARAFWSLDTSADVRPVFALSTL
jgi:2-methylcitrate dehydratase PrpD